MKIIIYIKKEKRNGIFKWTSKCDNASKQL